MANFDRKSLEKDINCYFSAFVEVNDDGVIQRANKAARLVIGGSDNVEIVTKNINDYMPALDSKNKVSRGIYYVPINGKHYFVFPTDVDAGKKSENTIGLRIIDAELNLELTNKLEEEKTISSELAEILEGSFDGILVTDKEGKVLYVNESYERVAEIKRSDMEGKYMRDLINPVWMPNAVSYVVAEQKTTVSKRQVVKSGRHIMVTGRPIFDKEGEIKKIIINARDITEIYDLSEELQKSKATEKLYMERMSDFTDIKKGISPIVAVSEEMKNALKLAEKVANFQATVLILGPSGVGKEEIAKFIHNNSVRNNKPFIAINCGAIPDNLLESELFGYEKGAFTGAIQSGKQGLLEAAEKGTIFLDEIGETPLDFQVKLLRFLETKEVRRVGALNSKTVDVRVLAATNRDLEDMISEGTFREDLYYRLNVVQIKVPPLSQRKDDILPLASFFLNKYNLKYGQEKQLTGEVVEALESRDWVGNVRELKNIIENMVIISNNEYLQTEDLPWETRSKTKKIRTTEDEIVDSDLSLSEATSQLERRILVRAKETCKTTREIADKLKVNQSTIVRKLQKYGLD